MGETRDVGTLVRLLQERPRRKPGLPQIDDSDGPAVTRTRAYKISALSPLIDLVSGALGLHEVLEDEDSSHDCRVYTQILRKKSRAVARLHLAFFVSV